MHRWNRRDISARARIVAIVRGAGRVRRRAGGFSSSGLPAGVRTLLTTRLGAAAGALVRGQPSARRIRSLVAHFQIGRRDHSRHLFRGHTLHAPGYDDRHCRYTGWGLWKRAPFACFCTSGSQPSDALAVSILFRAALLLAALPGVTFWVAPQTVASVPRRETPSARAIDVCRGRHFAHSHFRSTSEIPDFGVLDIGAPAA